MSANWECSQCTFINNYRRKKCEMCCCPRITPQKTVKHKLLLSINNEARDMKEKMDINIEDINEKRRVNNGNKNHILHRKTSSFTETSSSNSFFSSSNNSIVDNPKKCSSDTINKQSQNRYRDPNCNSNDDGITLGKLIKYAFEIINDDEDSSNNRKIIWYVGIVGTGRRNKSYFEVLFDDGLLEYVQLDLKSKGKSWNHIKESESRKERVNFEKTVRLVNPVALEKIMREILLKSQTERASKRPRPIDDMLTYAPAANKTSSRPRAPNISPSDDCDYQFFIEAFSSIPQSINSEIKLQSKSATDTPYTVDSTTSTTAINTKKTITSSRSKLGSTKVSKTQEDNEVKMFKLSNGEYYAIRVSDIGELSAEDEEVSEATPKWVSIMEDAFYASTEVLSKLELDDKFDCSVANDNMVNQFRQLLSMVVKRVPEKEINWLRVLGELGNSESMKETYLKLRGFLFSAKRTIPPLSSSGSEVETIEEKDPHNLMPSPDSVMHDITEDNGSISAEISGAAAMLEDAANTMTLLASDMPSSRYAAKQDKNDNDNDTEELNKKHQQLQQQRDEQLRSIMALKEQQAKSIFNVSGTEITTQSNLSPDGAPDVDVDLCDTPPSFVIGLEDSHADTSRESSQVNEVDILQKDQEDNQINDASNRHTHHSEAQNDCFIPRQFHENLTSHSQTQEQVSQRLKKHYEQHELQHELQLNHHQYPQYLPTQINTQYPSFQQQRDKNSHRFSEAYHRLNQMKHMNQGRDTCPNATVDHFTNLNGRSLPSSLQPFHTQQTYPQQQPSYSPYSYLNHHIINNPHPPPTSSSSKTEAVGKKWACN